MQSVYPLNVVISHDPAFSEQYNMNLRSSLLVSECMSTMQAADLVNNNLFLDKLILLNNDGEPLVGAIGQAVNWDSELMPRIIRIALDKEMGLIVDEIHELIAEYIERHGMG